MSVTTRLALAGLLIGSATIAHAATPPKQPDTGPGGAEYAIPTTGVKKDAFGAGATQVFVFRPTGGFSGPRPVIVLGHAVNAYNPKIYGAWIDHLVRRGAIVIFPRYQADARTPRNELIGHAAAGVRLAMEKLGAEADADKVAYVGHAAGGNIAANLASMSDLPKPRLLLAIMPGNSWGNRYQAITLNDLGKLPADLLIITMTGETDTVARDTDARKIIRDSVSVPIARKMIVRLPTDTHGSPTLIATHYTPLAKHDSYDMADIPIADTPAPAAPTPPPTGRGRARQAAPARPVANTGPQPEEFGGAAVDAADWFGFWKVLDIALPIAFAGEDATPVKRSAALTGMGLWSDGWPVKRMSYESAREPPPPKVVETTPGQKPGQKRRRR